MKLNFNHKDGVFAIKAENEEEKNPAQHVGGRHLQSHHRFFFNGEVQEMKTNYSKENK